VQSNARFGLSDRLEVHFDHDRKPAGKDRTAEKNKCFIYISGVLLKEYF